MAEKFVVPPWLTEEGAGGGGGEGGSAPKDRPRRRRKAFLEKTFSGIYAVKGWFFEAEKRGGGGVLRTIDPAARMGGALLVLVGAAMATGWAGLGAAAGALVLAVLVSSVSAAALAKRTLPLFVFTSVVTLPLFFEFSSGAGSGAGAGAWHGLWQGVSGLGLTPEGFARGGFFLARSTLMAALVVFMGLVTTRSELIRGLGKFPLPGLFTTLVFITLANIWRLLCMLEDSVLARKARTISGSALREQEGWFASRARHLLERALSTSDEVAMAMASRGFDGRMRVLRTGFLKPRDFLFIGLCGFVLSLALLV